MQSPKLARALYFTSEIGDEIMSKLYNAVAIALAYIYKINNGEEIEKPEIEIPEDMIFDEYGRKMINQNISKIIVTLAFFYSALWCVISKQWSFLKKIKYFLLFSVVLFFNIFLWCIKISNSKNCL